MLLLCGPVAAAGVLVEMFPRLAQERSERGAGSPVGALRYWPPTSGNCEA